MTESPHDTEQGKNLILIVDDVPQNLQVLSAILAKEKNYEIAAATSGAEALEAVEETLPDLILMDIMMPVMDGFAATQAIRSLLRPDAGIVPVLALTGNAYHEAADRARKAGMDACLLKPFEPEELFEVLVQYIDEAEKKKENKDGRDA